MFFGNLCLIYYLSLYTYVLRCSHTVDSNITHKRTDSVAVVSVCVLIEKKLVTRSQHSMLQPNCIDTHKAVVWSSSYKNTVYPF